MTARRTNNRLSRNGDLRALILQNIRLARQNWAVSANHIIALRTMTAEMRLPVAAGEVGLLDGKWDITHHGLMRGEPPPLCRHQGASGRRILPTDFRSLGFRSYRP